jgi:hypothetical protein
VRFLYPWLGEMGASSEKMVVGVRASELQTSRRFHV